MTVAQITRLRRELRNIGVDFTVVKNTLLKIASEGTKAKILQDKFHGPNAIVCIYNDPVGAAKVVQNFSREVPQLKIKAGFLEDQALSPEDILKLSTRGKAYKLGVQQKKTWRARTQRNQGW